MMMIDHNEVDVFAFDERMKEFFTDVLNSTQPEDRVRNNIIADGVIFADGIFSETAFPTREAAHASVRRMYDEVFGGDEDG